MILGPAQRGEHDHFPSCSAGSVDGPCSCARIAAHIERVRRELTESWWQAQLDAVACGGSRDRSFEQWVIKTLAAIVGG